MQRWLLSWRSRCPHPQALGQHAFFSHFAQLPFPHLSHTIEMQGKCTEWRGLGLGGHRLSEQWGGGSSVGPVLAHLCAARAKSSFLQTQPLPKGPSAPEPLVGCLWAPPALGLLLSHTSMLSLTRYVVVCPADQVPPARVFPSQKGCRGGRGRMSLRCENLLPATEWHWAKPHPTPISNTPPVLWVTGPLQSLGMGVYTGICPQADG